MADKKTIDSPKKVVKSESEWERELTSQQFEITRQHGTEPAFSGEYWNTKTDGIYECICCGEELYTSETKYDSGTGWPSFYEALQEESIKRLVDHSHGMVRTEAVCATCGAHLGHVFNDGPPPTGERFCMNSASLQLEPDTNET